MILICPEVDPSAKVTAAAPAPVVSSVIRFTISAAPAPDNACTPPLMALL